MALDVLESMDTDGTPVANPLQEAAGIDIATVAELNRENKKSSQRPRSGNAGVLAFLVLTVLGWGQFFGLCWGGKRAKH